MSVFSLLTAEKRKSRFEYGNLWHIETQFYLFTVCIWGILFLRCVAQYEMADTADDARKGNGQYETVEHVKNEGSNVEAKRPMVSKNVGAQLPVRPSKRQKRVKHFYEMRTI